MFICTSRDMEKNYRDKKMQLLWFSLFMASPKSPLNPHKVEHLQSPLPAPTLNGFYDQLQSPSCLLPAPFSIRSMAPLVSKSVCLTVCGLQLSWLIVLTQNMFNNTFCPKANVLFYVWILYAVCAMLRLSALLILIVNNDSRFLFLALVLSLFSHWTIRRVVRPCKSGWALLIPLLSRLRPSSTS